MGWPKRVCGLERKLNEYLYLNEKGALTREKINWIFLLLDKKSVLDREKVNIIFL